VLYAISFSHFLNDMIQSLILAIYPMLKGEFSLSFAQIGLITLTYQLTVAAAAAGGPVHRPAPKPHSLAFGMGSTLCGLLLLSVAPNFATVLVAAALVARARRCSTPSPRASRAWPRAGSRGWRSRSSRWAATRAAPWGRCWRRPWSCRTGRAPSPGSGWRRWWPSRCCGRSAPGTRRGT
jgi:hypothetical protein